VAFRGEVAYQPGRRFNVRSGSLLEAVGRDQLTAGVGVDIDGPFDVLLNLQLIHDEILDAPEGLA
ncbi:MAG: hypothetical protein F6K19_43220, partial [Cyanothece sp. SIO1E1]|nr:hypothetical protein [Cyanothece sp. SIO1E1]